MSSAPFSAMSCMLRSLTSHVLGTFHLRYSHQLCIYFASILSSVVIVNIIQMLELYFWKYIKVKEEESSTSYRRLSLSTPKNNSQLPTQRVRSSRSGSCTVCSCTVFVALTVARPPAPPEDSGLPWWLWCWRLYGELGTGITTLGPSHWISTRTKDISQP